MTTAVVTGAAGYLGGRVVADMGARGWDVRALHRPNMASVTEACTGADALIHLAAPNEVVTERDPVGFLADAVTTTWRFVDAASGAGVGRIVYVSTVHVYGAPDEGAVLTEENVPAPRGAYSIARLASEHVANTVGRDVVVLRLTNAVGAPADRAVDRWTLVANDLCRQGTTDGALRLRTHGYQWRDFVSLADVCGVVAACSDRARVPAGTFNLGSGQPMTVRDLAALVQDGFESVTGRRPEIEAPPAPTDPPKPYFVDVGRLAALGLRADGDLRTAIIETIRFCMAA